MTPTIPPSRLTVRFWGVRGSIPTADKGCAGVGGNTSCVEVRAGDAVLVLDAGTGARALGVALAAEAAGRPVETNVLFTHFHWDHLQGLPFFAPLYVPGNRVRFHAVTERDRLRALLGGQMGEPYFPVPFETVGAETTTEELADDVTVQIGPFTVTPFALHHPQGASGYRIEAGGTAVVYATDYEHGDAALDAALRRAAAGADLLISDAQYTPDEYAIRRGWGHTTYVEAARVAADAGVARLALFHHDPSHDDEAMARIGAAARTHFEATVVAAEGLEIAL